MKSITGLLIVLLSVMAFGQRQVFQVKDAEGDIIFESFDSMVVQSYVVPPPEVITLIPGSADTLRDLILKEIPKHRLPFYSIEWETPGEDAMRKGRIILNNAEKGRELLIVDSFSKDWIETKFPGIIKKCTKPTTPLRQALRTH